MARGEDLTGRRFGMLTVLRGTNQVQDRYKLWICKCDCGQEILVNTKRLKRGTVTNCGCIPKTTAGNGSRAEDLTGRRFGQLTVIRQAESLKGRTMWLCRCDCGNEKTVAAHELKNGKTRSCGCLKADGRTRNSVDLTGQRFGRLTALYLTGKRDKKGSLYWHCRCDCGNEADVTEDSLVYGNYRSCGCLKKEIQKDITNKLHRIDGTCVEWIEKRKHRKDNTSGFRGVCRRKNGSYSVSIGFKRHQFYLGVYQNYDDAVNARLEAEHSVHDAFVEGYYLWKKMADSDPEWAKQNPYQFDVEKDSSGRFRIISNIKNME